MATRSIGLASAALALALPLAAQAPPQPVTPTPPTGAENDIGRALLPLLLAPPAPENPVEESAEEAAPVLLLAAHSPAISRAAFVSCDANADDRLNILEASRTLDGVGPLTAPETFRPWDIDNDGHIEWLEFDARFRAMVAAGTMLRLHPTRTYVAPPPPPVPPTPDPLAGLLILVDADGDGQVTLAEIEARLIGLGAPEGAIEQARILDRDGDGSLSSEEMAPLAALMPPVVPTGPPLPPEHALADLNADGALDAGEVGTALVAVDPRLGRWSAHVLRDADRGGDGLLQRADLVAIPPSVFTLTGTSGDGATVSPGK